MITLDNLNIKWQPIAPRKKKIIAAIRPKVAPKPEPNLEIDIPLILDSSCYQFPFTEELLKSKVGIKNEAKAIIQKRLERPLGQCPEVRKQFGKVFKTHTWIFDSIERKKIAFKVNFPTLMKNAAYQDSILVTCRDMSVSESVNLMPKALARQFRELPKQGVALIDVKTCISVYRNIKLQEFLKTNDLFVKLLYNSIVEALELRRKGF